MLKEKVLADLSLYGSISVYIREGKQQPYVGWDDAREAVILNSNLLPPDFKRWRAWQQTLRLAAWANQKYVCFCGEPMDGGELHHGLISRANVQGLSKDKAARKIHHTYNCIFVHPGCHGDLTREICIEYLCERYGQDEVESWYRRQEK